MIFDRLSLLQMVASDRAAAYRMAARWSQMGDAHPEIVADIVRMGDILAQRPRFFENGVERFDPTALALQQGRRDMAQEQLALIGVSHTELLAMMENNDEGY